MKLSIVRLKQLFFFLWSFLVVFHLDFSHLRHKCREFVFFLFRGFTFFDRIIKFYEFFLIKQVDDRLISFISRRLLDLCSFFI